MSFMLYLSARKVSTADPGCKRLGEELELLNKELVAVRHDRLKKYYEACYEEYAPTHKWKQHVEL